MNKSDKRIRKFNKILNLLNEDGINVSDSPTKILYVSNSSVLVGVTLECLEKLFHQFDPNCNIFVFPNSKSHSFIQFSNHEYSISAKEQLDGKRPEIFPPTNPPITLLFVDNLPKPLVDLPHNNKITGLKIITNFISEQLELELINFVEANLPKSTRLKNRHVLHFGYKFNYDENNALEFADPIPTLFENLVNKIMDLIPFNQDQYRPNQVTINIYEPSQGIPPHLDTHSAFKESIYSLSLYSDVVMEFRDIATPGKHYDVLLARRSLMQMCADARYRFKHGIMSRKYDVNPLDNRLFKRQKRISITFRTTSEEPCNCHFPEFCDWDRNGQMRVPISDVQGIQLEKEYVEKVYDRIAEHFDQTRHSNWSGVASFINQLTPESFLLDVGCGNGKYLWRQTDNTLAKIGCDLSHNLLKIAKLKGCAVFRADALELPVRDGLFDAVILIAVIHHFSTYERRMRAISEILRVLKTGGIGCVTAWAFEQIAPDGQTQSIYASKMRANKFENCDDKDWHARDSINVTKKLLSENRTKLRIHDGKQFIQQDMLVPWSSNNASELSAHDFRYYHLFVEGELSRLVEQCISDGQTAKLVFEQYDEGNWVVVFKKQ